MTPHVTQLYLHDKPEPGLNCPQDVYNVLTTAIDSWHFETEFHSYIFEAHAVKKLRVNMVRFCFPNTHKQQKRIITCRPTSWRTRCNACISCSCHDRPTCASCTSRKDDITRLLALIPM